MTVPENHIPLLMYTLFPEDLRSSCAGASRGRRSVRDSAAPFYTNRFSLKYHHLCRGSDSNIRPNLPFLSVPEARSIWITQGAGDDVKGRGLRWGGWGFKEVEGEGWGCRVVGGGLRGTQSRWQLNGDVVVAAGGAAARAGGGIATHHHAAPHHLQPAPCNVHTTHLLSDLS